MDYFVAKFEQEADQAHEGLKRLGAAPAANNQAAPAAANNQAAPALANSQAAPTAANNQAARANTWAAPANNQVTYAPSMHWLLIPVVVVAVQDALEFLPLQDSQTILAILTQWGGPMLEKVLMTAFCHALYLRGTLQQEARARYQAAMQHFGSTVWWDEDDIQKRPRCYIEGQGPRAATCADMERVKHAFVRVYGIQSTVAGNFFYITLRLLTVLEGMCGYLVYLCLQELEEKGHIRKWEYRDIVDGKRKTISVYWFSRKPFSPKPAESVDMQAIKQSVDWFFRFVHPERVLLSQLCKDAPTPVYMDAPRRGKKGLKLKFKRLHKLGYPSARRLLDALGYTSSWSLPDTDVASNADVASKAEEHGIEDWYDWYILPPSPTQG